MPKRKNSESDPSSPPIGPQRRGHVSIKFTIVVEWASDFFGYLLDWLKRLFRGRVL